MIFGRHQLAGSGTGGIRETHEVLDFCAEHDITSDVELVLAGKTMPAYARLLKSDCQVSLCCRYAVPQIIEEPVISSL